MPDLQRVFEYHGAEHKTISCYEAAEPLTPENAQRYSRFHPRCGTSFLLLVMIVAIVVFAPLGKLDWPWLFVSRILGIPVVAGLAFELIKWFGRNRTKRWARALMWPGMQLQRLTTREPDLSAARGRDRRARGRAGRREPARGAPRRTWSAWKSWPSAFSRRPLLRKPQLMGAVLLTGATGFVGREVLARFLDARRPSRATRSCAPSDDARPPRGCPGTRA